MRVTNATIADLLRQYAAVLSLEGVDRFRLKAYRRAAETIEGLSEDVTAIVARGGDLTKLPGVGHAIRDIILEILERGRLVRLDQTISKLAPGKMELASKPKLDPKKVERIYKKLGIASLRELQNALDAGTIREVLGERMEFHIRNGLDSRPRELLWKVLPVAESIMKFLSAQTTVTQVSPAGSLRRKQETIGDLSFLVAGKSATAIFQSFAKFKSVQSWEVKGRTEGVFKLSSGLMVTLRWTAADNWGLALLMATGSVAHLADVESTAKMQRISLTKSALDNKQVDRGREASIYEALGLKYIEPELREGRGEIAAAATEKLPQLLTQQEIRGDLHMHTTASDGSHTIEEMAEAAHELGYEYIAITDHSQSLKITNGLTERRLFQHIKAIDKVNARLLGFRILKSAEVDILETGKLDYSAAALKELDFTICSIHSRFALNRQQQTERIMRAMDNPYFNILGHATGRLLLRREGYDLDMERIIAHARENKCLFEINANPNRLDLSDEHAKLAKEAKIKIAINTDAHSISELRFMTAGIHQARRGWLEAADVLNTYPLRRMLRLLRR